MKIVDINGHLIFSLLLAAFSANVASSDTPTGKNYPDGHGGKVFFPMGDVSFADEVVSFEVGTPKPRDSIYLVEENALSYPKNASLSLGCKGVLIVRFTDNLLIDIPGPDLYVFEIGGATEPTNLKISEDGKGWIDLGDISGGRSDVDITGFIAPGTAYSYVMLTDLGSTCFGDSPGADIDAVGAIGSALRLSMSSSVLFDTGKFELKPDAKKILDEFVAKLEGMGIRSLTVEGHTDDVGLSDSNQLLSEKRALSVKKYLTGLPMMQKIHIVAKGYGESRPLNDNGTAQERQINRRVQLIASPFDSTAPRP